MCTYTVSSSDTYFDKGFIETAHIPEGRLENALKSRAGAFSTFGLRHDTLTFLLLFAAMLFFDRRNVFSTSKTYFPTKGGGRS